MQTLKYASYHKQDGWQGQYNRMMRWFIRCQYVDANKEDDIDLHTYFDTLYACFQNVFFLKDWLKNDASIAGRILNSFINQNVEMGICRDVCNGTKHFDVTDPSVDPDFEIISERKPLFMSWRNTPYGYTILAGGNKYDPLQLVQSCIDLWDNFLAQNALIKPTTIDEVFRNMPSRKHM